MILARRRKEQKGRASRVRKYEGNMTPMRQQRKTTGVGGKGGEGGDAGGCGDDSGKINKRPTQREKYIEKEVPVT